MKAGHDPRVCPTFVGREEELRAIAEAAVKAGRRRLTITFEVVGAPGSGKSRLIGQALEQLHHQGLPVAAVVRGRCPTPAPQPLAIFQDLLRGQVAQAVGNDDVDSLIAHLVELLGDRPETGALLRGQRGLRALANGHAGDAEPGEAVLLEIQTGLVALFSALGALVEGSGWPLVVVLDDLQWLDVASTKIGRALLQNPGNSGLLLFLVRRKSGAVPGRWRAKLSINRLNVGPLHPAATRSMVIALLGVGVAGGVAALVARNAAGDPFAVEQLSSLLIDRGDVVAARDGWTARRDKEPGPLPESIEAVVSARFSLVSARGQDILAVCAVGGEALPRIVVKTVTAHLAGNDRSSAAAIGTLVTRGWLQVEQVNETRNDDRLTFTHARLRDGVLQVVSETQQARIHLGLAAALEKRYARAIEPWLGVIAAHYDKGGDQQLGMRWRLRSGRHALALSSMSEAQRDLERAVRIATTSGEHQTLAEALSALAEVFLLHGDCNEAIDTCDKGLAAQPPSDVAARLYFLKARALVELQKADEAAEIATLAEQNAPDNDAGLAAQLHLLRARLARYAMDVPRAFEHLGRAVPLAKRASSDSLLADALVELAYAAVQQNHDVALQEAYAGLTDLAATAGIGPRGAAFSALGLLASAYLGDMPRACRAYDEAARIGRETGELPRQLDARIGGLMARCYLGRLREGEGMRRQLIALGERVDVARHNINLDLILATLEIHRGAYKQALRDIRRGLARIRRLDVPLARHDADIFAYIEGQVLWELGEHAAGRRLVEDAVTTWHRTDALKLYRHEGDLVFADILVSSKDLVAADEAIDRAEKALLTLPNRYYKAWACTTRARWHFGRSDYQAAIDSARRAQHHAVASGSDYQRIRALTEEGRARLQKGDGSGAKATLNEAAVLADKSGAMGLLRQIRALSLSLPAATDPA